LMLQREDISLGKVRVLFDGVIKQYPSMNEYLSARATIIQYPEFESGMKFIFYF
jgi:hypothetical protein